MKKIIIMSVIVSALVGTSLFAENKVVYISSDEAKEISKVSNPYSEALDTHASTVSDYEKNRILIDKNKCEINKVKKVLLKLIEKSNNQDIAKPVVLEPIVPVTVEISESEKEMRNLPVETTGKCKTNNCDPLILKESYMSFKETKVFTPIYYLPVYDKPMFPSHVIGHIKAGESFESNTYTVAGWVKNVDGGWIRGFQVFPKLTNETTEADIEKWNKKLKDCNKDKE